jgi:hypothetical protein
MTSFGMARIPEQQKQRKKPCQIFFVLLGSGLIETILRKKQA